MELSNQESIGSVVTPKHPFLSKPLYAFDLPQDLIGTLQVRSTDVVDPSEIAFPSIKTSVASEIQSPSSSDNVQQHDYFKTTSAAGRVPPCSLCPSCSAFSSLSSQRAHFRSDWHRYNVQLNLRGVERLVEQASFEKLCEEVDSDTEIDSDTEKLGPSDDTIRPDVITKLLERLNVNREASSSSPTIDQDEDVFSRTITSRSPLLWFVSKDDAVPEAKLHQTQLGFHRAVFPEPGTATAPAIQSKCGADAWYRSCLESMQVGRVTRQVTKNGPWTGKRVKSKEIQEAAKPMSMNVLDGHGFLPGLQMNPGVEISDDDSDDYSAASDEEDGWSVSVADSHSKVGLSSSAIKEPPLRMWTFLIMGGGHFAAAVICLNPHVTAFKGKKRGVGPREERSLILLAHKTFHRYTTRRKQGGSQALQDASGKFAKSAGATLRRYNETALNDEIRALLGAPGWRQLINRSEKIWIRAGARTAKGTLWAWEGSKHSQSSPLDPAREDGRMDPIPFPTRRPTIGETIRCFFELTRVKVGRKTDEELEAQDKLAGEALSVQARKQAEAVRRREKQARDRASELERSKKQKELLGPQLSDEEKAHRSKVERMVEMVRKGRLEVLISFLAKHENELLGSDGINTKLPEWWLRNEVETEGSRLSENRLIPVTLLQLAAEGGSEQMVRYLLVERRADPTTKVERAGDMIQRWKDDVGNATTAEQTQETKPVDPTLTKASQHRTAYDLCSTKEARNLFRKMMADQPDWYDWGGMAEGGARVSSALTNEMQEQQTAKQKDRRAAMREKAKERAAKAAEKQPAIKEDVDLAPSSTASTAAVTNSARSHTTTNRLGGGTTAPRALLQKLDEQAGLTPEMKARIEREKRARAAEERMKALMNKK